MCTLSLDRSGGFVVLVRLLSIVLIQMFLVLQVSAQESIWVFEDVTASLSIEEVASKPDAFTQVSSGDMGRSNSAFWVRVELENESGLQQTQVVQFHSHVISKVEAFRAADTQILLGESGTSVPLSDRAMPTMLPSFPVTLDPDQVSTLYFKITSDASVSLGHEVTGLNQAIAENTQFTSLRYALILSLLLFLTYNIASAIIIRQPVHWLYAGFVSLLLLAQLIELQILRLPLVVMPHLGSLTFGAGLLFLASLFCQLQQKIIQWVVIAYLTGVLVPPLILGFSDSLLFVDKIVKPIGLLLLFAYVVTAFFQRKAYSKFILFGWMAFFGGAVVTALAIKGVLPVAYHSAYAVGSVVEVTFFSIALAYRLRDRDQTVELLKQQKQNNELQKEMFAVIGHELRTPVAAIHMIGRDKDIDSDTAREQILDISENVIAVLEDLRLVVAPERALEAKAVKASDPVQVIKRALNPLGPLMKENSKALLVNISKLEGNTFLLHDQPLRQVVTNLTKNAALYSGGNVVSVSFDYELDADAGAIASLTVEDDGRGIPEASRQQVFEPFGRGETDRDGSGLGLFIVKEIASLMEGTLEYSTSQLGGACFTLTFPMKAVDKSTAQIANEIPIAGLRVLLAEDDAMLRMLTEKVLTKLGAQVTSYTNGQEVLDTYQPGTFDVVLTDLMMPLLNGHELTKKLRALGCAVPIIGVTAAVMGEETDSWLNDGANAFISKPITPEKLQQALVSIGFCRPEVG